MQFSSIPLPLAMSCLTHARPQLDDLGLDLLGKSPLQKCIVDCEYKAGVNEKDFKVAVSKIKRNVKCMEEKDADATGV